MAAPFLQALSWRVPFGQLSVPMVVRASLGAGLVSLLGGLVTAGLLGLTELAAGRDMAMIAAGGGAGLGLVLVLLAVRRSRLRRGALLLAFRASEPDARDQALRALHRLLSRRRGNPVQHAEVVLLVVAPLSAAGLFEDAEQLLSALGHDGLPDPLWALRVQALASCRVQLGDLAGAREALAEVDRPAPDPGVEAWLATIEALLAAVDGKADEALELLGEGDGDDRALTASRGIVRAHALAGKGDRDGARTELKAVRKLAGKEALARAVEPRGPASDIARDLMG